MVFSLIKGIGAALNGENGTTTDESAHIEHSDHSRRVEDLEARIKGLTNLKTRTQTQETKLNDLNKDLESAQEGVKKAAEKLNLNI